MATITIPERAKQVSRALLNGLLPPRCISCYTRVDQPGSLCAHCWAELRFLGDPCCSICSHPFPHDVGEGAICASCIAKPPPYDRALSVLRYDEHSRPLITRFKYYDQTQGERRFVDWMTQKIAPIRDDIDLITPVPLHPRRLIHRTYFHSALLARGIANNSCIFLIPDLLVRTKHTPPQASLSKNERRRSVRSAFALHPRYTDVIRNKHVLLVDDVMTTGATIHACTRALKRAGASKVFVITLARTVIDE